jgi:hypothetical protein
VTLKKIKPLLLIGFTAKDVMPGPRVHCIRP